MYESGFMPAQFLNRPNNYTLGNCTLGLKETHPQHRKPEPEPEPTQKELEKIETTLTDFISNTKNVYDKQKTELVEMINATLSNALQTQEQKISELIAQNLKSHPLTTPTTYECQEQSSLPLKYNVPQIPIQVETKQPVAKRKRIKYEKIAHEFWPIVKERYPLLDDKLESDTYIADDKYYVRIKNMYYELSTQGLNKILNILAKNN